LRYLAWLEERGGAEAALNWLDRTAKKFEHSELSQHVYYARARYLEKLERLGEARTQFLEIARRFPYPQGTVWDDSLFAASLLDERLGNSRAAVSDLERMLREREPSHIQGSYERPLYAQARFRIALLYRDRFSDPARARREFRRVFDEHRTSLLRDDALWNEALLAKKSEGASATCAPLKLLVGDLPDSRYVPCAHELCSELKPVPGRTCRGYILRAMKNGQPPELPSMPTLYSSSSSR
jgi:tetratricopeptide (TPR) repeat protein